MDTAEWPAGPVNAPPTSELQPTAAGPQSSITPPPAGDTPPNVLAQAQQVALQGGPAAVSRFMADAGYPKSGAWCGQFAAAVASSAGVQPPAGPAVASNWRNVGTPVDTPQVGDVAIARPGWAPRRGSGETGNVGSHVTFVNQANPAGTFQGLGGNQGSMVKPFNAADFEFRRLPGDVQGHRIVGIPGEEPSDAQGAIQQALGNSGNVRLASYAPDGGAGAPIPGMGGAGSPRLQPGRRRLPKNLALHRSTSSQCPGLRQAASAGKQQRRSSGRLSAGSPEPTRRCRVWRLPRRHKLLRSLPRRRRSSQEAFLGRWRSLRQ